jgi:hypothetical protein
MDHPSTRRAAYVLRTGHGAKKTVSVPDVTPRAKVGRWCSVASEKGTANDQSHYRHRAVFLHGRYGDWSRSRRCDLPDLAPPRCLDGLSLPRRKGYRVVGLQQNRSSVYWVAGSARR